MITIAIISLLEFYILKTNYIALIFIRRIEFTTNYIASCYFDFFSLHEADYFRSSFLRHFGFISPYSSLGYSIGNVIGSYYTGISNINFNNGLISDALANLGYTGIVIMPFILGFFLHYIDKILNNVDNRIVFLVSLYTSLMLLSTFLTTALLTHGLIIELILIKLIYKNSRSSIQ